MSDLETLRTQLPEAARDIKLNLQACFEGGALSPAQKHGVAIAVAAAARHAAAARRARRARREPRSASPWSRTPSPRRRSWR